MCRSMRSISIPTAVVFAMAMHKNVPVCETLTDNFRWGLLTRGLPEGVLVIVKAVFGRYRDTKSFRMSDEVFIGSTDRMQQISIRRAMCELMRGICSVVLNFCDTKLSPFCGNVSDGNHCHIG